MRIRNASSAIVRAMPGSPTADDATIAGALDQRVPDAIVRMDGVSRTFDDVEALRSLSLAVGSGVILGLIGPSGAGKTTTLRLLTGALAPTRGTVRVLGEDPRHLSIGARQRIGYMPQQFTLLPDLTADENVDFVATLFGLVALRRRRRVREVLELVGLSDARGRRAGHLSGGMQRRVELASALVHEPRLLFLDEPTAGVDPLLRTRIWQELHRLRETGRTLVVTTQYLTEAESCDHVALIAEGRLVALGTPLDLRRESMGGDAIEIETAESFDARLLESVAGVRSVRQTGLRTFRVVLGDAATGTPDVMAAIASAGAEVTSSIELRPTFDEVFATLVGRAREDAA